MTLRCALYARYSSDQQRAASIENQFRICREHTALHGYPGTILRMGRKRQGERGDRHPAARVSVSVVSEEPLPHTMCVLDIPCKELPCRP